MYVPLSALNSCSALQFTGHICRRYGISLSLYSRDLLLLIRLDGPPERPSRRRERKLNILDFLPTFLYIKPSHSWCEDARAFILAHNFETFFTHLIPKMVDTTITQILQVRLNVLENCKFLV